MAAVTLRWAAMDPMQLLSQARQGAGSLVEKALAIDDALGSWEDRMEEQVTEKITEKIKQAVHGEESDSDEEGLEPEERLQRERARKRKVQSALELERDRVRELEATRDELEAALQLAKETLAARDTTIADLDGRLVEYAELIPRWERKMEEERRAEDETRRRQQQAETDQIKAMADAMVADAQKQVELERAARATIEFRVAESFEDKARATADGEDMLELERERYRSDVNEQRQTMERQTMERLRSSELAHRQAAMSAEQ